MKEQIRAYLESALDALRTQGEIGLDSMPEIPVERSRGADHGDFASTVALVLAKRLGVDSRKLAAKIVEALPSSDALAQVSVAGPGFINFHLTEAAFTEIVRRLLAAGGVQAFAHGEKKSRARIQVEFVSANPTGPLHVGHGRGAAYGASVSNLLAAAGFDVQREYYVNDAGRQMHILALSVWMRYLQALRVDLDFPSRGYRGDYVLEIAQALEREVGADFAVDAQALMRDIPPDAHVGKAAETHIDALITRARERLGEERYRRLFDIACESQVEDIKGDLGEFGVVFDRWFSERELVESGEIERALERLRDAGHLYDHEGARWFRSTDFGDEKDRVVVRENGESTYFASDIAYVANKFARGFERIIYVWGADHHGYIKRVKAATAALGHDPDAVDILLVQFATLMRAGQRSQMSTRSGDFVTLRELREDVGSDAARFFYAMRSCSQHLDFDLDLAKSRSNDNPVYYVQYAHARIAGVLRQCRERGWDEGAGPQADLERLVEPEARALMMSLSRYPEVIAGAACTLEPHQIANYLRELAGDLHAFYNAHVLLAEDDRLRGARLSLIIAVQSVLADGLALLGVGAPDSM
ncbi:arginine--tRNA ligase [Thioalkalivibrio sp. HK1]|uniref:arginine--tRNA ligase n=1 Tax=Thioalkalivibrio sp. HK1 TaxID=1469245 RepID=UPI00047172D2|nr:arginine--tRNA ligase [Thioalkalivibrio sp. HK1]